jgi:hypothetical protein
MGMYSQFEGNADDIEEKEMRTLRRKRTVERNGMGLTLMSQL